jgi:hypothetical protein
MTDESQEQPAEQYDEWKQRYDAGEESARDLFRQVSHISQFMSHDLLDKLRWWEQDTLEKSDDEVEKRLEHMSAFLKQLQAAYLHFSEIDF